MTITETYLPTIAVDPANFTGLAELPFTPIVERELEMEVHVEHGPNPGLHKGPLTLRFGQPTWVDGKGWACVFQTASMGREQVSVAGGADSLQALQLAFHMAGMQLVAMAARHTITFLGSTDLGFYAASPLTDASVSKCPFLAGTSGR